MQTILKDFLEKDRRLQACEAMLSDYQGVYKQIIPADEFIYAYDPKTTDQSSEYRLKDEAKPKRYRKIVRKSRRCWQFFSIIVVLRITNFFQLVKLSTRNIF